MRIGLICPYSLTLPGGVQAQVLGLARSLRTLGHEVRVVGPCDGAPPEAGVTPIGRSIPFAANGSVAPLAPDVPAALRTLRVLAEERFDVVHVHEPLVPGPALTTVLTSKAPIVATFHAAGVSAAYRIAGFALRRALRRVAVRCVVSDDALALVHRYFPAEYVHLFNGIEVERFAKATPWPTEVPTILFVGRHEPRKGLSVLLDAIEHLDRDVRLWIASDGPQTAELQQRTAGYPRVEWLGRVSDEEKARRLRGADVFCAPSLHGESFGVVLLEAMAAGAAIVASDLPGYRNVARPDVDALLVAPGDPSALAAGLGRVLDDAALAESMVASGEARAASFSMDTLAERYVELYEEAVG